MSRSLRLVALVALPLLVAAPAPAQILDCGKADTTHTMRQTPNYKKSVDVVAVTTRAQNICPTSVQTEAWVDAMATPYITTASGLYSASAEQTRPVPSYGKWHSSAKHWLITLTSGLWTNLGTTYGTATVVKPPDSGDTCLLEPSDCLDGYEFKPGFCQCVTLSPILVDTAGDGFRLSSAEDGVEFDINDNGQANERVAWTEPDSDDAWLVLDRNGNGIIDSGRELFGSMTSAYFDSIDPRTENGFDALFLTEGPSYGHAKVDRIIDAQDTVYSKMRLWFDRNHNGRSDEGELVPLDTVGLLAIDTKYKEVGRRDRYGNKFQLQGRAVFRGPENQPVERPIYDVFLTVWPSADARLTGRR